METENKKLSYVAFLGIAVFAGLIGFYFVREVIGLARIQSQIPLFGEAGSAAITLTHPMLKGIGAGVFGLATFLSFALNAKAVSFAEEVMGEIRKVTWPTRQETVASTIVVSVMVVVCALIFLVMDIVWANIFRLVI